MPATSTQDVNSPAYKSAAHTRQLASLQVVRDLAGGTPKMRACRTTYLPMEEGESVTAYDVRLARSLLFNTFVKVRDGLVGMALKPRRKPKPLPPALGGEESQTNAEVDKSNDGDIQLREDVPPQLKAHIEDIDLCGNHLDVFAKELFRNVVNDGHAFIFVDMARSASQPSATLAGNTRADSNLRRPNWVSYKKDQALNWRSARIGGEIVLTRITFEECTTEPEGAYGEKDVRRFRVLELPERQPASLGVPAVYGSMQWEIYEERTLDGKTEVIATGEQGKTNLARIPVVPIYSRKTAFLESEPPLIDLAYLNIGHWQQWSDLNCQIRMLVPILHIKSGELITGTVGTLQEGDEQKQTRVSTGPGTTVITDKDGDVNYKSADAAAVGAAREALQDLEQRMSAVGLSIIAAKQDREVTASEKVMDQDERMSELASWLRNLKDGIEQAFHIHAVWYLGLPTGGSILLGFDEPSEADQASVTAINAPKGTPQNMPLPNSSMMNGGVQ